ncbi:MAG: hypothetical protein J6Y02_01265 [Pseudobutyrivibrio sp.]|nr:hypothetical protein [Pseudobutyrivibrio sp.]
MTKEEAIEYLKRADTTVGQKIKTKTAEALEMAIKALEQEPRTGQCKDCKWWKDSDGVYRRGVRAESQCPINTVSVAGGWGYCYKYEPRESEGTE